MKVIFKALTLLLVLVVTSSIALAQFAKPGDAIRYRKAVMRVIGQHFGSMGGVIKGQKPYDKTAFAADAKIVAVMSKLPWEASMVPGSFTGDTRLMEKVLKDTDGYMAAAKKFEDATQGLLAAAEGGDMGEKIKTRFGATASTCGGCHKAYRK